mgnify:CR=1 FL=1
MESEEEGDSNCTEAVKPKWQVVQICVMITFDSSGLRLQP